MEKINIDKVAAVILMVRELDRAEPELRAFIERMDEDEQAALVAIMWIGRGAFEPEDWAEAFATAWEQSSTPTADYLIGTPHMSDHLEAGLNAMGQDAALAEAALI